MANPIEYIVFEPDQVLTNDHLNESFNYLDQQNRWTRNKLIGIGIVCGLDIVINPGIISVTRGTGVTSQGYLITQDAAQYAYYMPYSPIDVPNDLPFVYSNGDLPFYKPYCANKNVWLLLTDAQYNALESDQQKNAATISSATMGFLSDYAVVLFLEANETDLKNCDTFDCNNKGERMAFQVRPLLVAKVNLSNASATTIKPIEISLSNLKLSLSHQIYLKRYNVPFAALNSTDDVLNAFVKLVDDTTLSQVATAYNYCYTKYQSVLKISTNPFVNLLTDLTNYRNLIQTQNPIYIEYFYDLIDDLIKAYYEFSVKISGIIATCCPDENLFPLHLVLGDASQATDMFVQDSYRTYFIYSPLFSKMGNESAEVILLFNRMVIMVKEFTAQTKGITALSTIKITPSQYEYPWLSERAIPYYYNVSDPGSELYKSWNYHKTKNGNAAYNLGYNADVYSTNAAVMHPLLYDIEYHNFFRIEGHIGQNYQTALSNILNQRLNFNLPIDVVAISADQLSATAVLPECNMRDLETEYKLITGEAACKIHVNFCFITKMPYTAIAGKIFGTDTTRVTTENTTTVKFSDFKLDALKLVEPILLLDLGYRKGDFMRKYCPALPNTIGSAYLSALSNAGVFTNPVLIDQGNSLTVVYHYFFEFVDSVEEIMYVLNTSTLANIDMAAFGLKYQAYLFDTAVMMTSLEAITVNTANQQGGTITLAEDYELDLLVDELGILTSICIDERLQVLKDEYTSRLTDYQKQLTFLNYYKNHPGLEHKAGVPKGGTFVLVYHSVPPAQTSPTNVTGASLLNAASFTRENTLVTDNTNVASVQYDENTLQLFRSFVDDCNDAPPAKKQLIIDILSRRPLPPQKYQIPDGAVVADFYIPYMCCSDCSPVAYILPDTKLNLYIVSGGGNYCVGGAGCHINLSGSDVGVNYQLFSGGAAVGSPVAGTGTAIDFGLQTAAGTYTVTAANVATGNSGNMTGSGTIAISPLPGVFNVTGDGVYCQGVQAITISLSGSEQGVNYQVFNGTQAVGAPVAGGGNTLSFSLPPVAATYTVVATNAAGGCTANMTGSAKITINPLPKAFDVTGSGGYCEGSKGLNVGLSGSETGVNYQLFNGTAPVGTVVEGTGAAFNFGVRPAGTYTVTATVALSKCTNNMNGSAVINVNPLPKAIKISGKNNATTVTIVVEGSEKEISYMPLLDGKPIKDVKPVTGTGGQIILTVPTVPGTYTVVATNPKNGCSNTMTGSVVVTKGKAGSARK